MKQGTLIFDEYRDLYDIRFDLKDYLGGLYPGDQFEVFAYGKWKPTEIDIDKNDEWYLKGIRGNINGLRVRVKEKKISENRKGG